MVWGFHGFFSFCRGVGRAGMKTSNNGPCLGWRNMEGDGEFKFHSYNEVHDYAVTLGTALIASGLEKVSGNSELSNIMVCGFSCFKDDPLNIFLMLFRARVGLWVVA